MTSFFNVKSMYGFMGAGLALVALYLVLENGNKASDLIKAGGNALMGTYKVLQGRG